MSKNHVPHPKSIQGRRDAIMIRYENQTRRTRLEAVDDGQDAGYFNKLAYDRPLRKEAGEDLEHNKRANARLLGEIMAREASAQDVANASDLDVKSELLERFHEQSRKVEELKSNTV